MREGRVLVVDDTEDGAEVLGRLLGLRYRQVWAVQSLADCLALLDRGGRFDVLVLEVAFRDARPWQVADALAGRPGLPPVVVHTSWMPSVSGEPARRLRATAVLMKPAPVEELEMAIDRAMAQTGSG